MFGHNYIPFLIAMSGIISGVYTLANISKLYKRGDRTMVGLFFALAFLNIYIGVVYVLVINGTILSVPMSELSFFMRPANLFQIVIPFWISWRMGL